MLLSFVIPAHVGIQGGGREIWTPACAGMMVSKAISTS